jgi:hypothetical protein
VVGPVCVQRPVCPPSGGRFAPLPRRLAAHSTAVGWRFSWPDGGCYARGFPGALDAFPPRTMLPERTDSHPGNHVRTEPDPQAAIRPTVDRAATEGDRGQRPIGGSGGRPPGHTASPRRGPKGAEHRATPGGYGGKPPGVAIIGVPTGARNAGRCSDGGPEHQLDRTTNPTLTHQTAIEMSARTVRNRCCSTQREHHWRSKREQRLRGAWTFIPGQGRRDARHSPVGCSSPC